MALFYTMVQHKVLAGEDKGVTKWYGRLKSTGQLSFEELCEEAAHHSMVTYADVAAVLKGVLKRVTAELADGNVVQLGRLCNIRLSAGSKGTYTKEEFRMHHMKRPRVVFVAGKRIRDMLKKVGFRQEPIKEIVHEYEKCEEHPPTP